jgi:hypothetical protein
MIRIPRFYFCAKLAIFRDIFTSPVSVELLIHPLFKVRNSQLFCDDCCFSQEVTNTGVAVQRFALEF